MPKLHVVCLRPGPYNRGGKRHEGHSIYEAADFNAAQLREMHDDPNLALIVGGEAVTEEQVAAAERADAKAKAEAEGADKGDAKKTKG